MTYADLSAEEAEACRAQVEADGPARLHELAELLAVDGIDLSEFDASIPSLGPLWAWYLDFARTGFPGIPADAQPRTEAIEPAGPEIARAGYAAELIAHYLVEVARRCFQRVKWVTNDRVGMDSYQRVAVQYVDDDGFRGLAHLDRYTRSATLAYLNPDNSRTTAPDYLRDAFLDAPFICGRTTAERCRALPRGTSILQPMLGTPRPPEGDPIILDTSEPTQTNASNDVADAGGELLFAHMSADVEDLEHALPLDLDTVLGALTALDVRDIDGRPPTRKSILAEEFAEFTRNDDAQITTLVAGKKLRAVQIASINPTPTAWTEITDAFTRITQPLQARLAPEDEFDL